MKTFTERVHEQIMNAAGHEENWSAYDHAVLNLAREADAELAAKDVCSDGLMKRITELEGGAEAAPTPMPVSRYDFTSRGEAVPVRNGLWVDYRDYEALEKLYIKQTNCCEYVTQSPRDDG